MSDEKEHDPQVYLSAERTLLSWLRTGITVMAFGFVVARFGLFVKLLEKQGGEQKNGEDLSLYIGASLVAFGVLGAAGGAIQFYRFLRSIPKEDIPTASSGYLALLMSILIAVVGAVLAVVLLT